MHLHALGYKTRNGNNFSKSSLNSILTNEKYKGTYVFNKNGHKRKKKLVLLERYKEVRNADAVPEIVDKSTFDKAQEIMQEREVCQIYSASSSDYLLSGLIRCSKCGRSMTGTSRKSGRKNIEYHMYACPNHKSTLEHCETFEINRDYLEGYIKEAITALINELIADPLVVHEFTDCGISEADLKLTKTKKELTLLEKTRGRLIEKITFCDVSIISDLTGNLVAIKEEIKNKEEVVKNLEIQRAELVASGPIPQFTVDSLFSSISLGRTLVRAFIKSIKIDNETIEIELNEEGEKNY